VLAKSWFRTVLLELLAEKIVGLVPLPNRKKVGPAAWVTGARDAPIATPTRARASAATTTQPSRRW
jgi:hypothetical protein